MSREKGRSELRTRLVFGPLMLGFVALIYWLDVTETIAGLRSGTLTAAVLALLAMAGIWEYVQMFQKGDLPVAGRLLGLFTVLLCGSAFGFGWRHTDRELYPLVIATFGLLFPIAIRSLSATRMQRGLELQGGTLLGFLMIAWPMYLAEGMALRHLPSVLFVVLVCKVGDIGAYLTGIAIGKRKLIPHISGGKTVEGALGGVVFSCVVAAWLAPILLAPAYQIPMLGALGLGIVLNLTTQIGDLIESLLKRRCGVKDSSNLLPAHGGVLDLIDSLLFSFPAHYLIMTMLD